MLGLYVHIPFCARQCPYCDFAIHVGARDDLVSEYLTMLRLELELTLTAHSVQYPGRPLTSIFFGGGTPTALSTQALTGLLQFIGDHAEITPDAEISIEANPDGLGADKLMGLRAAGWNRLSLGAQSFDEAALKFLGRTHTPGQIEAVLGAARRAGFDNISLDFIYAVPGQSRASWRETVQRASELEPEHVSCYALTIEGETPFARRVEKGRLIPVADEAQADLMQDTEAILREANLLRYEVSNYARPGHECRHNLNYWRGGDYLACGCGAHGHANGHRWWNERATPRYISLMRDCGSARVGEELLQPRQRLAERIMLGLRLGEGIPLDEVSQELAPDIRGEIDDKVRNLLSHGILLEQSGVIRLAPGSMAVADAVASRLIPA